MVSKLLFAAAAATMMVGALAQSGNPPLDALTLAYNLECLEAEFYAWAATGAGLNETQRGGGPASVGAPADFDPTTTYSEEVLQIATEIYEDELAHVLFLREAISGILGPTLACPLINVSQPVFDFAATAAARAALMDDTLVLDPPFDPYANDLFFLHGAFIFEDVGVTAYRGAIPRLLNISDAATRSTVLTAAAGIHAVEAYHAGIIRDRLSLSNATVYGLTVPQIVGAISDLRDSVTEDDQDQGIVNEDGTLNLVPTDSDGIAFVRTEEEALAILSLGGDSSPFYPEGLTVAPDSEAPAAPVVMANDSAAFGAVVLAYNLECLEAEFYSWAAYGEGLNETQRGGGPASVGAAEGFVPADTYSSDVLEIATEIAEDEVAHVLFLRAAVNSLTGASLSCPQINVTAAVFNTAATAAAQAALGDDSLVLEPPFDPYANDLFFLHGAFIFEDVGVTAYLGQVDNVLRFEDAAVREQITLAAAGILAVEAYHAGIIRDRLSLSDAMPFGLPVPAVVGAISDLRDSVTPDEQDQGITNDDGTLNLVPADENGIVYARTADEAVAILNLGGDSSPFFPEGFTPVPGSEPAPGTPAPAPGTPSPAPGAPAPAPSAAPSTMATYTLAVASLLALAVL